VNNNAMLDRVDTRVRLEQEAITPELVQDILAKMEQECQTHMDKLAEVSDEFRSRFDELGDMSGLGEEAEMAILEESAQVETTVSNLHHMDFTSDLEAATARLLREVDKLRAADHRLRDYLNVVFLAIARDGGRLDKIDRRLRVDPLTELPNRIGVETTLAEWWEEGRHESGQMGAVLLDLENPSNVIGHSDRFLLQPEAEYECVGQVPNVVFTCGAVENGDGTLNIYYAGADRYTCLATARIQELIDLCLA